MFVCESCDRNNNDDPAFSLLDKTALQILMQWNLIMKLKKLLNFVNLGSKFLKLESQQFDVS